MDRKSSAQIVVISDKNYEISTIFRRNSEIVNSIFTLKILSYLAKH